MLFGHQSQQANPLENLILVEDILGDPTLPNVENARSFALHSLLVDLIRHEFHGQRQMFNLDALGEHEPRSQVLLAISQDVSFQAPELVGWGILYCRYVRVDLGIRLNDLVGVLPVDIRTLRRYQSTCIKRLTEIVTREEWSARQQKHSRQLYARLPSASNMRILGRDSLLNHALMLIERNSPPRLLITGPGGIGKTAFVQVAVQSLIDSGVVDELVWLTRPPTIGFVRSYLKQTLLNETDISLREYTHLNRLILVVDDASLVDKGTDAFALWGELGNALVIVTNKIYRQFGPHFIHLVLPELDEQSVGAIVAAARPHLKATETKFQTFVSRLYDQVGGNPLAVKLAANNLSNINLQQPLFPNGEDLIRRLIASTYEAVSQEAQKILLVLALLPAKPVMLLAVTALWPETKFTEGAAIRLLSCGLIENTPGDVGVFLPDAVRSFVQQIYAQSESMRAYVGVLIAELMSVAPVTSWVCEVVEYILLQDWLEIKPSHQQKLAELNLESGVAQGHYANWSMILESVLSVSPSTVLTLYYAICLRQLLEFSQAERLFREVIDFYGREGDFRQQSRAMLEFGVLLRQQGLYESAQELIESARQILDRWDNQELLHRINLEFAQVLLDSGDIDALKPMVADLAISSADDVKATILLSEILLQLKDYDGARLYAERATKLADNSRLGRVYAILGRIASEEKDFASAQDNFAFAVTQLEQEQDWYGLARTKSNLAAVLIGQRQYLDDAAELLRQAQATQRTLNDRAGMIYTAHNFEVLNTVKWIDET